MEWLKSPPERRSYSLENPSVSFASMFTGGDATISGRPMSDRRALSLSPIWAAVHAIGGDLATVSLKVLRRMPDNTRSEARDHPLYDILAYQPTDMVTSTSWRESALGHLLLRGNHYAGIQVDGRGRVTELVPFHPDEIERKGRIYLHRPSNTTISSDMMVHFAGPGENGVDGWSVIKLARESWSLASALEESNARFIANASRPSGFLTTDQPMSPETLKNLKEQWVQRNAGLDNVGNTPVLDGGFTWQRVGLTAEDSQFLQTREFSVSEIARWFNIPPHKLQDLSRATFSNIEQQQIHYVVNTLTPWATRLEQEMNMKLLTSNERADGYYIKFMLDSLLRGDIESRTNAYRAQFEMGALTPNEIRALEDRNPIENGDDAYVRLDMAPLSRLEEIQGGDMPEENAKPLQIERRLAEYRSPDVRIALRESFRPMFLDATQRLVRGEIRNVRRIIRENAADAIRAALEAYYFDLNPEFAFRTMNPVFRTYANSVAAAARAEIDSGFEIDSDGYADLYTETFATRYSARSRTHLDGQEPDEIERRLSVWADGDAERQAKHFRVTGSEIVKLADAVALESFIAGGVLSLIWRSVGDSCPYCLRLNGTQVSSSRPFLAANEPLEVDEEGVPPLVSAGPIRHAPAHRGCNCIIVPG